MERIEREIEEISTQILNIQHIKKSAKHRNIELRKESKKFILNLPINISNGKNIKLEPINSNLKNKIMSSFDELLGIIPFNRYLNY